MPTLNLFTNVPVDAVVASDILKDATKVVAKIIGKPESVCQLLSLSLSPSLICVCIICICVYVCNSRLYSLTCFHNQTFCSYLRSAHNLFDDMPKKKGSRGRG